VTSRDADFAPNPKRVIYVQGVIEQQLLYRLTPQIIELHDKGSDPITVYIDSPGGIVSHMESLLQLLRVDQDADKPRRFITIVTSQAASAAAELICWLLVTTPSPIVRAQFTTTA
jgi:ATP-dependent protease ClpP protease subunit